MNETIMIVFSSVVGLLLGLFFFGGLAWTIKIGLVSKIPALVFIVSFAIRTSVTLLGFMFVSQGRWERLISSLVGFVIVRMIIMHNQRQKLRKIEES